MHHFFFIKCLPPLQTQYAMHEYITNKNAFQSKAYHLRRLQKHLQKKKQPQKPQKIEKYASFHLTLGQDEVSSFSSSKFIAWTDRQTDKQTDLTEIITYLLTPMVKSDTYTNVWSITKTHPEPQTWTPRRTWCPDEESCKFTFHAVSLWQQFFSFIMTSHHLCTAVHLLNLVRLCINYLHIQLLHNLFSDMKSAKRNPI